MAVKHFCDLCGEPAMDVAFTEKFYKRDDISNRKGFHLCVEFTEARERHPIQSDERADCCNRCMAEGLKEIADALLKQG